MKTLTKAALAIAVVVAAAQANAQVTFYENQGFQGRAFTAQTNVADFGRFGFNDRASSVMVTGERWEVCEDVRYLGRCVVLRPGQYSTLGAMGLNDRISSVRAICHSQRIDERRYAPAPAPAVAQITFYEDERFGGRSLQPPGVSKMPARGRTPAPQPFTRMNASAGARLPPTQW
ncbi:beta/gamma crystallin family protein [Candidatus Aalborgicola defluviihabitans]|uniref:beta/gamma crystallin family protein n=1 Tax=Candidatus Aalborgicola defluviihabitans TaxID=3386187 RepID=UPI00390A7E04|nr:beta/gamma crystallin family protein [Burkholderiales bacterium]